MIDGKTVLAVIPARGGSKRVPRKNLREYRGKPLIQWAWDEGKKSKYIDTLQLSTEDKEISIYAELHGIDGMYRPAELATDTATSEDVLRHALSVCPADWAVLLQPTSPLRTADDIDACIERAQLGYGCVSVTENWIAREDIPNGAVYVATAEWIAEHDFSEDGLLKYRMPEERSLDIDHPEDFEK